MKSDSILLFASILFSSLLIAVYSPKKSNTTYIEKAMGNINEQFQQDLKGFYQATEDFYSTTNSFLKTKDRNSLQESYQHLRVKANKIGFLLEYLDKEAYDKMINGAPLPKLEKKVADLTILKPKGLQVIDELIGVDSLSISEINELRTLSSKLANDVKQIKQYLSVRSISDRQFFEASRQALIRLTTLGITGFDTPGTQIGITDTKTQLATLSTYMTFYKGELTSIRKGSLLKEFNKIVAQGLAQVTHKSFEEFDRLLFIKTVVHPLYKNIRDIHLTLDYETIDEVSTYPLAVNYQATQLFQKEFLNSFYYVSIANDSNYNKIASLGKLLFYDPVLSGNNTMSCVSCHAPDKAFTDGLATSVSNTGYPLKRNAMTLNYVTFASGFFHDLRTKRLEDQFEHVVLNKDEFNSDYISIISKLKTSKTYTSLFNNAFPDYKDPIRPNNIDYALTAYVMQLNTFDSPVDHYFQGSTATLPEQVKRGFNLFTGKANCASCHFLPTFSGLVPPLYVESEAEVLGVPDANNAPWVLDDDIGRLGNGVTQDVAYFYKNAFKTPTLRNIEKTAPYMHNGVYNTLEEVMDFYNKGGGAGLGISVSHQTLSPDPLDLTQKEIADIIAFMNSLTDTTQFTPPTDIPRDFEETRINERRIIQ
ncbi:cytochrome c peroxidase [Aquimarina addita]|uniref:Cytochrome c peroxidase n=1 Tax=Aquimarina addita TaxID=870485 RepID=A0ABP7XEK9_9FLAO